MKILRDYIQGNKKSVIDFVLLNEYLYSNNFLKMYIDDSWNKFKISDHNLIVEMMCHGSLK